MSKKSEDTTFNQLTLFAAASRAKTYRWLDAVLDWLENEVASGGSSIELLQNFNRDGVLSKMSPVFCQATEDEIWVPSSGRWANSGMGGPTVSLTLSTSEWPKDAAVCLLSDVLEMRNVPHKYYLSQRAAKGILRRAAKRGKELPPTLQGALESIAKE